MNMIAKKPLVAPADGADVLAALDRRLVELQTRREALIETIINAEKSASAQRGDTINSTEKAQALLDGGTFELSREMPFPLLAALRAELDLIDRALAIGRSEQHRLSAKRATEVWASFWGEIAALEMRRVTLALQLQSVDRQREALRDRIAKAGGAGFLSTDGPELLGLGGSRDEIQWCVDRLVADGVATRRELEKASST
jgi:hypothetical protein